MRVFSEGAASLDTLTTRARTITLHAWKGSPRYSSVIRQGFSLDQGTEDNVLKNGEEMDGNSSSSSNLEVLAALLHTKVWNFLSATNSLC
ncbi:hypothetical protein PoB_001928600 [Plakobranchus ocellatus]|uniref:Uncharacterized protein n=1 Tax=Plakobranchus ocellatus TaxID=259542 RepID=A0AAV3Z0D5_9GAST|nr:hypothetical protein PoB_001928600 [Plakobranchus ocellatus]